MAPKGLIENKNIVITKADKGSTIVILDREQYVADGEAHLSDRPTYEPLQQDITEQTQSHQSQAHQNKETASS